MNLAIRDIQHNFGRFVLTTLGVGMLLMIVMGMAGMYRGASRRCAGRHSPRRRRYMDRAT